MPPRLEWYAGREAIAEFLTAELASGAVQFRLLPLRANGGAAVAVYQRPPAQDAYSPAAITLLSTREGCIAQMTRFAMPHLFPGFGLPERLVSSRS